MSQVTHIHTGGRKTPVVFFPGLSLAQQRKMRADQTGSHFARYCGVAYDLLEAAPVTDDHRKFFKERRVPTRWTHFIHTGPNCGIVFRWTGAYVICGRFWASH